MPFALLAVIATTSIVTVLLAPRRRPVPVRVPVQAIAKRR